MDRHGFGSINQRWGWQLEKIVIYHSSLISNEFIGLISLNKSSVKKRKKKHF